MLALQVSTRDVDMLQEKSSKSLTEAIAQPPNDESNCASLLDTFAMGLCWGWLWSFSFVRIPIPDISLGRDSLWILDYLASRNGNIQIMTH